MLVSVAVENTAYSFDKAFSYKVPKNLENNVKPGMRVTVPFGAGNKTRVAVVLAYDNSKVDSKMKAIISVLEDEPVLTDEMIKLVFWIKQRYFCTLFEAVKLMLPAGISYKVNLVYKLSGKTDINLTHNQTIIVNKLKAYKKNITENVLNELEINEKSTDFAKLLSLGVVKSQDLTKRKALDATEKMVCLAGDFTAKLSSKQQEVYEMLQVVADVSVKELSYFTGASISVIKALVDKGAAKFYDQEVYRKPKYLKQSLEDEKLSFDLSFEQAEILDDIVDEFEEKEKRTALLYGITGSGKTSIFLKLIDYVIGKGQDVILMVPEIALTPQTIQIFKSKFGNDIAVFHSGLSIGERMDQWKMVERGLCKLAIGTRSAVFAPFKNIGLIVIDEEQEHTYKSEITPRYNAKEIARFRCAYSKAYCLLSSATPSLESYYMAKQGIFGFHKLEIRYGGAILPAVRIIDMNQEELFGNKTDISFALKKGLNDNFRDGKQSIVLLNRRGYHTMARCTECHTVLQCPHCSISLTMHSANNRLMCHYCGYSTQFSTKCPECNNNSMTYFGYGTQRAEESLQNAVEGARILRIDADSTSAKYSLEKKLDAFAKGDYDIMVGTQMVAKGLNFENVTLVGVLSADQSLYSDDFRSNERTFDLLTQVVGRSGRGKYEGQAIIQSYMPENSYLRLGAAQDYVSFYEMEKEFRKVMLYPPFVDILVIGFVGEEEKMVRLASEYFLYEISSYAREHEKNMPLRILRPSPAVVAKVGGKYRYKLIIKCKNTKNLRDMVADLLVKFAKNKDYANVTAFADPNPYSII
ncbi:MAG: primosomal protein N' [Clostridia bacterium]